LKQITGLRIHAKVFPVEVLVGVTAVTAAVVVDGGVCGLQRSNCCIAKINDKIDVMRQKSKLNQVRDVLYLRQCTPGRSREAS